MKTQSPFRLLFVLAAVAAFYGVSLAQIPGRNVNMVSGTTWPGGDPFLQRQNEPSCAVSSVNPQHLLCGANDYRTMDLPGLLDPNLEGLTNDAWLGLFKSFDGGRTWRSTLLPGCPYADPQCTDSVVQPLLLHAGSDPTVRPGTHGLFYYSGIAFSRGSNAPGVVFVSRFFDYNNRENAKADSIQYHGTWIVDRGNSGQFQDKPWLAADTARGAATCTIPAGPGGAPPAQSIPAGTAYLAYSTFTGSANNVRSKVSVAISSNCGQTFDLPIKLSESNNFNLGTTVAIDPVSGAVYVAWRRIAGGNEADAILIAKSVDFGRSWTKAIEVTRITPFDQVTQALQFRARTFPGFAISVDSNNVSRVHLVWAQRGVGPGQDARTVMATSSDGTTWPAPIAPENIPACKDVPQSVTSSLCAVDDHAGRGHQLMPALTFAAGKLMLVYYDLRDDSTVGIFTPLGGGLFSEQRRPMGNLDPHSPFFDPRKVFTELTTDATPGLKRRHIMDVRALQGTPGNPPLLGSSVRVSRYAMGRRRLPDGTFSPHIEQVEFNAPNLMVFNRGQFPFIGDYIDVAARLFKPNPADATRQTYVHNTAPSDTAVFHAVWTDNRDVRLPKDGNPANYTPVGAGGQSVFDPSQTRPTCQLGQTGTKNQNIYTARLTQPLVVVAFASTKNNLGIQRSFLVFVENAREEVKSFRLTIPTQPTPPGQASFLQFSLLISLDVMIPRLSQTARLVFVKPPDASQPLPRVTVNVCELEDGVCKPDGLQGSVVLNEADATALIDPDVNATSGEVFDPAVGDPQIVEILSTGRLIPDIGTPTVASGDPTVSSGDPTLASGDPTLASGDPTLSSGDPTLASGDPTLASGDPTLASGDPTLASGDAAVTDASWPVTHGGNSSVPYSIKRFLKASDLCCPASCKLGVDCPTGCVKCQLILHRLYSTPVARGCNLGVQTQNVVVSTLSSPGATAVGDLGGSGTTDPTIPVLPLVPAGNGQVTLRGFGITSSDAAAFGQSVANSVRPVSVSQSVNTVDAQAGITQPPVTLTITTIALADGVYGQPITFTFTAIGGIGTLSWSLLESTAPGLGPTNLSPSGLLSFTPTSVGTFTLKVKVVDSGTPQQTDSQKLTLTVQRAATTTTIQSDSPDPSVVGQVVTVTFTVKPAFNGTPTGTVTVSDGTGASCSALVAAGSCTLTPTTAGSKTLRASYPGDDNFTGSTGTETHQVKKAHTTTTITSDLPDPSVVGQPVTVAFTVTVNSPGSGTPTQTVTVSDEAGAICSAAVAAQGSCTLTLTTVGKKTLTATYSGDSNFNDSFGTAEHQVIYVFIGFLAPLTTACDVEVPSCVSNFGTFLQGQALAVKWQEKDFTGDFVANKLTSLLRAEAKLNTAACAAPPGASMGVTFCKNDGTVTCTGSSAFRYDSKTNQYILNADTNLLTKGACYDIVLTLDDTKAYRSTGKAK